MHLKTKIEAGEFVVLAEMEPPKGADISSMIKNARRVKEKVDAFLIPEMSNAVMRMSSLGGAIALQQAGMETVMQICCRDRNRLALQADLLAASACGISNVMAVSGQDPRFGDHHQAMAVYDITLMELLDSLKKLQDGKDMAGIDLRGSPRFLVGSTVQAQAKGESLETEIELLNQKSNSGARFFITPPVFDLGTLGPFNNRVDRSRIAVIPTVLLLKSAGMARYMSRNVEHVVIPDTVITRIQNAPDKVRECIQIAAEMIAALRSEGFSGVSVSTIGWEDKLPDILERI
ncbi:MAG: methylenetetrahydrofolate reductase [Deltaproteobacteria bacterium]|nr:methylenetetrahydrofolate reductase [Deltaproteobacteria bacterium]